MLVSIIPYINVCLLNIAHGPLLPPTTTHMQVLSPPTQPDSAPAASGDTVRMSYEGRLLDGSVFDSSDNFKFTLGEGEVIKGTWAYTSGGGGEVTKAYTVCRMPYTVCRMPYAIHGYTVCRMSYVVCHIPYAVIPMPYTVYHIPYPIYRNTVYHIRSLLGA